MLVPPTASWRPTERLKLFDQVELPCLKSGLTRLGEALPARTVTGLRP